MKRWSSWCVICSDCVWIVNRAFGGHNGFVFYGLCHVLKVLNRRGYENDPYRNYIVISKVSFNTFNDESDCTLFRLYIRKYS